MIKRSSIKVVSPPSSLNWRNGELIDWVSGDIYKLNGEIKRSNINIGYRFDAAKQSANGVYAVIYEKLGTKGLILKNGQVIREINRSYYFANAYEYPIEIFKLVNNEYAIVHCPEDYNLIEIELIETGERITETMGRKPDDCFHSRLQVNSSNTHLLNAGWVWHPYGVLQLYGIENGIKDNGILDKSSFDLPINGEVSSVSFLNDDLFFVATTTQEALNDESLADDATLHPSQIGLFSISKNRFIKKSSIDYQAGTLVPINEDWILDLYECPKLIDVNSGKILEKFDNINSGKQDSSIIHGLDKIPPVAVLRNEGKMAIGTKNTIELFEWPLYV